MLHRALRATKSSPLRQPCRCRAIRELATETIGLSQLQDTEQSPAAPVSSWKGIDRFYNSVTVVQSQFAAPTESELAVAGLLGINTSGTNATAPQWQVVIDGRALKTIGLRNLKLPTEAAALAIAAEFALQRDQIITASTPLYNLACNAIDGYLDEEIAEQASRKALSGRADDILRKLAAAASDSLGNNAAVEMPTGGEDEWLWSLAEATAAVAADGTQAPLGAVSAVCATSRQLASPVLAGGLSSVYDNEVSKLREVAKDYLETDSACFRVMSGRGMSDHTLRKRQDRAYRPFLDWFRDTYGTELAVMEGFSDSKHPSLAYVGVEDFVDHADHFLRASLAALLGATKSTTISMALLYGHVTLDQALEASRVEEQFQIEENGFVEDGHDTQFVQLRVKAAAAAALMRLAPESGPLSPAGPFAAAAGMPMADASGHGSLTTAGLPAMVARTRLRRVFELAKTEKMQEDARLEQQEVIQARGWDKLSPEELDRRMIQSHLESISQAIPASGSDTR